MVKNAHNQSLSLADLWMDQAFYRPGQSAHAHIVLRNTSADPQFILLNVRLFWIDELLWEQTQRLEVPEGEQHILYDIPLPQTSFRGYGLDLVLSQGDGILLDQGSTALDVLDNWTQAPRYGFLSDFAPGSEQTVSPVIATLARYHITVVQFYDWMWRHYELMPPHDEFVDSCGRHLALSLVQAKVNMGHTYGMAALGYAAVYGAEGEYALAHPDEMLYDADGNPYSLVEMFYIMNIHQGNPWRQRIIQEMLCAIREVPFDGLHLDQYGFPTDHAFGPPPDAVPYDLAQDFPPFINDVKDALQRENPASRVIFNAVRNWPIETVAATRQDATYIEVWPPYESYHDLQSLILAARRLAPQKQVILAAYLEPLKDAKGDDLLQAEVATRLTSAAIWANGGFHLLIGESDGALCDPYYPAYATMRPEFASVMRHYADFVVRYENLLADLRLVTMPGQEAMNILQLHGVLLSFEGEAGKVWGIVRDMPSYRIVGLINLQSALDTRWNSPKSPPVPLYNLEVAIQVEHEIQGILVASPESDEGRPRAISYQLINRDDRSWIVATLPQLEYWSMIVIKTATDYGN
jgi:dextranase